MFWFLFTGVTLELVNWDNKAVKSNKRELFNRESDMCLCKHGEDLSKRLGGSAGSGGGGITRDEHFVESIR